MRFTDFLESQINQLLQGYNFCKELCVGKKNIKNFNNIQ